ncbi:hypothetical protein M432DRAFT_604776 [Thermoascus aurantiacus ATCC 26904]
MIDTQKNRSFLLHDILTLQSIPLYKSRGWKNKNKMPVYHIVLFRLKPGVTQEQLANWARTAKAMVGKIPGLISLHTNAPLPISVPRAKGFNMGLVAVLELPEHVAGYAAHPAHLEVHKMREELCEDTLAYDLEFEGEVGGK